MSECFSPLTWYPIEQFLPNYNVLKDLSVAFYNRDEGGSYIGDYSGYDGKSIIISTKDFWYKMPFYALTKFMILTDPEEAK